MSLPSLLFLVLISFLRHIFLGGFSCNENAFGTWWRHCGVLNSWRQTHPQASDHTWFPQKIILQPQRWHTCLLILFFLFGLWLWIALLTVAGTFVFGFAWGTGGWRISPQLAVDCMVGFEWDGFLAEVTNQRISTINWGLVSNKSFRCHTKKLKGMFGRQATLSLGLRAFGFGACLRRIIFIPSFQETVDLSCWSFINRWIIQDQELQNFLAGGGTECTLETCKYLYGVTSQPLIKKKCNGCCLWISYGQCWVLPVIVIPVVMDLLLISWLPLPVYIQEINWNRCESWPLPQTMGLRICIDIRMLTHFILSLAAAGTETRCGFGEWDVAMWRPRVMWRYWFFFRKLQ